MVPESPATHVRDPQPPAALAPGLVLLHRRRRARLRAPGRRSACRWRSPTGASCACSARARRSTRSRALWTAAAYDVPVTFLILRNEEYAILKWFGEIEQVTGAPGLDLPALEVAAVAEGYGVPSSASTTPARCARCSATRSRLGPRLVEARVAPGMALVGEADAARPAWEACPGA